MMQSPANRYPSLQQSFGLILLLTFCSIVGPILDEVFNIDNANTPFLIDILADMLAYGLAFTIAIAYGLYKMGDPRGENLRLSAVPSRILLLVAAITPFAGMTMRNSTKN